MRAPRDNRTIAVMTTVTTDLLNARLKTVETRMDARITAIETAIAGLIQSQSEMRADIKNLKSTMIVTAIASVLAVGAINATVFSNMLAAFQSGKDIAAAQAGIIQTGKEVVIAQAGIIQSAKEVAASQAEIRRLSKEVAATQADARRLLQEMEARDRLQPAQDKKARPPRD